MHSQFLLTRPSRDVTGSAGMRYSGETEFLLTRPSRDVTMKSDVFGAGQIFLLTRPSRDVTKSIYTLSVEDDISTHTPLAGRDQYQLSRTCLELTFLLTRPSRDVTKKTYVVWRKS